MSDQTSAPQQRRDSGVSAAFQTFLREAPDYAEAWGNMVQGLANASALDDKTAALAYLAVLAALRLETASGFMSKPLAAPALPAKRW